MIDLSKNNLLSIKLQEIELYLSCNTDIAPSSLMLSNPPIYGKLKAIKVPQIYFQAAL